MKGLNPVRGRLRRWFHKSCGFKVRGDLFIADGISIGDLLIIDGLVYLLTGQQAEAIRQTILSYPPSSGAISFDGQLGNPTISGGTLILTPTTFSKPCWDD